MSNTQPKIPTIPEYPPAAEFCLSVPLYEIFRYNDQKENGFFSLEQFEGTLDFHCPECNKHSVFKSPQKKYTISSYYVNYVFSLNFSCSRDHSHKASFVFKAHKGIIEKIGQYPSLADLALPDLRKYRPVLGSERFKELTRAIGLTTHGVGVGAFVYLRRIFESLIEDAHQSALPAEGWDEDAFSRGRMDDKILVLRDFLPKFLVENRGLYGVLSVGVHTLSEAACLAAFPAVRLAIELILDDLLEKREREEKLKSAAQSIAALKTSSGKVNTE